MRCWTHCVTGVCVGHWYVCWANVLTSCYLLMLSPRGTYSFFYALSCVMSLYWRSLTQVRLSLEQICVKDLLPVGSKKPSASGQHGGVVKMGRVFWAKELKYLHAHVDSSTDGWGALVSTNKGNKERATITDDPGVPNATIELDIAVDKKGESVEVVTPARSRSSRS